MTPQQFWKKVARGSDDECWPWAGSRNAKGYGQASFEGNTRIASRVAFMLATGRRPKPTEQVCHRCDNPPCCNPAHLFLGTAGDNARDMVSKSRKPPRKVRGELNPKCRLTEAQVREIRAIPLTGERGERRAIARRYGVSSCTVQDILRRRSWLHV